MIKINVYNQKGEQAGDLKLSEKVFGVALNQALVHQAVVAQMANERQVIAHTKDRSEVRGGGKKPWKQKGTGRARAGSSRSPIWIGGGVTFGPRKDRNFKLKINKKMKQKAFQMILSDKVANSSMIVLDKLELNEFKTKTFLEMVKALEKNLPATDKKVKRSLLVINNNRDEKVRYSGRNLAGVEVINGENMNIVDLLKYKNLMLTKDYAEKLQKKD